MEMSFLFFSILRWEAEAFCLIFGLTALRWSVQLRIEAWELIWSKTAKMSVVDDFFRRVPECEGEVCCKFCCDDPIDPRLLPGEATRRRLPTEALCPALDVRVILRGTLDWDLDSRMEATWDALRSRLMVFRSNVSLSELDFLLMDLLAGLRVAVAAFAFLASPRSPRGREFFRLKCTAVDARLVECRPPPFPLRLLVRPAPPPPTLLPSDSPSVLLSMPVVLETLWLILLPLPLPLALARREAYGDGVFVLRREDDLEEESCFAMDDGPAPLFEPAHNELPLGVAAPTETMEEPDLLCAIDFLRQLDLAPVPPPPAPLGGSPRDVLPLPVLVITVVVVRVETSPSLYFFAPGFRIDGGLGGRAAVNSLDLRPDAAL